MTGITLAIYAWLVEGVDGRPGEAAEMLDLDLGDLHASPSMMRTSSTGGESGSGSVWRPDEGALSSTRWISSGVKP